MKKNDIGKYHERRKTHLHKERNKRKDRMQEGEIEANRGANIQTTNHIRNEGMPEVEQPMCQQAHGENERLSNLEFIDTEDLKRTEKRMDQLGEFAQHAQQMQHRTGVMFQRSMRNFKRTPPDSGDWPHRSPTDEQQHLSNTRGTGRGKTKEHAQTQRPVEETKERTQLQRNQKHGRRIVNESEWMPECCNCRSRRATYGDKRLLENTTPQNGLVVGCCQKRNRTKT